MYFRGHTFQIFYIVNLKGRISNKTKSCNYLCKFKQLENFFLCTFKVSHWNIISFFIYFIFPFLHFVSSCCLGLHFIFSITKSCNLLEVLWFCCRDGSLEVFPPPTYRNPGKTIQFGCKRFAHRQSKDINYKLRLLYRSTADNYNLPKSAKLSELRHEDMSKPKLARLPNWTDSSLHIVHGVPNLILQPRPISLLCSKARRQSGHMGSIQPCHHLPL